MKNYLLLTTLLLTTSGLLAQKAFQKGDLFIHISIDDNWGQTSYIEISKKSEQVIISSPGLGKLKKEELLNDTAFLNLRKKGATHPTAKYEEKFKGFINQHSTFDTTVVTVDIGKDREYNEAIKQVTTSNKTKLEKSHEVKDIVMDASDFTFTMTTDNNTKKIYAKGLFKKRYPILANFMNLTYTRLEAVKQKQASIK